MSPASVRALATHAGVVGVVTVVWALTGPGVAVVAGALAAVAASVLLVRTGGQGVAPAARADRGRTSPAADAQPAPHPPQPAPHPQPVQEAALREQILDAMDDAVLLIEGNTVAYVNKAGRTSLGATVGRPPPAQIPAVSPEPRTIDITVHHPARRELAVTSVSLPGGKALIVARDVTAARRTDRVRREFVANASHELKTPVAGILAAAETLVDALQDDPAAASRFARRARDEAVRLSNIVQDLLDLARFEQPDPIPVAATVDLSAIINAEATAASSVASTKGVEVHTSIAPGVAVRGGAEDLALLVRNLLENAVRYTAEGSVRVTLVGNGAGARLDVSDTGIGIPGVDLPRIFERFYRVDKARSSETGGTGLGLSIVRHVAARHGGTVEAVSELGKGSTFTVRLPGRYPEPPTDAPASLGREGGP